MSILKVGISVELPIAGIRRLLFQTSSLRSLTYPLSDKNSVGKRQ